MEMIKIIIIKNNIDNIEDIIPSSSQIYNNES